MSRKACAKCLMPGAAGEYPQVCAVNSLNISPWESKSGLAMYWYRLLKMAVWKNVPVLTVAILGLRMTAVYYPSSRARQGRIIADQPTIEKRYIQIDPLMDLVVLAGVYIQVVYSWLIGWWADSLVDSAAVGFYPVGWLIRHDSLIGSGTRSIILIHCSINGRLTLWMTSSVRNKCS